MAILVSYLRLEMLGREGIWFWERRRFLSLGRAECCKEVRVVSWLEEASRTRS